MAAETLLSDPRFQDSYMKGEEFERARKELLETEKIFRRGRDEIFGFPRSVHPLAVACKSLSQTFELLYPKDSAFNEIGTDFSDAFSGVVAAYNEMNTSGKDIAKSLDQWFVQSKNAIDIYQAREKNKKNFDHYYQKLSKMKADLAAKKSRNPSFVETPKDAEWHLRNERKYDSAKNGYILTSQQSYNTAMECLKLKYEYLNPILDNFAKNMIHFFKTAESSLSSLSLVNEKIKRGQELMKKREEDKKAEEMRIIQEKLQKEREEEEKKLREKQQKEREIEDQIRREIMEREYMKRQEYGYDSARYEQPYEAPYAPANPTRGSYAYTGADSIQNEAESFFNECESALPRHAPPPPRYSSPAYDYPRRPPPSHVPYTDPLGYDEGADYSSNFAPQPRGNPYTYATRAPAPRPAPPREDFFSSPGNYMMPAAPAPRPSRSTNPFMRAPNPRTYGSPSAPPRPNNQNNDLFDF